MDLITIYFVHSGGDGGMLMFYVPLNSYGINIEVSKFHPKTEENLTKTCETRGLKFYVTLSGSHHILKTHICQNVVLSYKMHKKLHVVHYKLKCTCI